MTTDIQVIDAPMGQGKSTAIINMLNKNDAVALLSEKKYIIATPYLAEVERFKSGIVARTFIEPKLTTKDGAKRNHFRKLVEEGKDIVTTHALIGLLDAETLAIIKAQGYTIIIDEDMETHRRVKCGKLDVENAIALEYISVNNETKVIEWIGPDDYEGVFDLFKEACEGSVLYEQNKTTLMQTLAPSFYEAFERVYLLTYLFEAGDLYANLMLNGLSYEKNSVKNFEIVAYDKTLENRKELRDLINVYEGKLNDLCGHDRNPFSSKFYNTRAKAIDFTNIKNSTTNYVRKIIDAKSEEVMWTCLKAYEPKIKGKGYTKGFVPVTQKASNEFAEKRVLIYLYNRYSNPFDIDFYKEQGVEINDSLVSISSMLQWVFRSRIRNGEAIELYCPSKRMREQLDAWANFEI